MAIEKAKEEGATLTALFILDSEIPASIFDKLTDIGFAGEKPSQQLQDSILIEYRDMGQRKLEEIAGMVKESGVTFEALLKEGDFATECIDVIREKKSDLVIVTRKNRSSLSRFIFGSPLEQIKREIDTELIIVDE